MPINNKHTSSLLLLLLAGLACAPPELDIGTARLASSRACPDCEDFVPCFVEYTETTLELSGSSLDAPIDEASLELAGPAEGCALELDPEALTAGEPWTISLELPGTCPTEEISAELLGAAGSTLMASVCEVTKKPES